MSFILPDLERLGIDALDFCASVEGLPPKSKSRYSKLFRKHEVLFGRYSVGAGSVYARLYGGWLENSGDAHLHVDLAQEHLFKNPPTERDMSDILSVLKEFRDREATVELSAEFSVPLGRLSGLGTITPFVGISVVARGGKTLAMTGGTFTVIGGRSETKRISWRAPDDGPLQFTVTSSFSAIINDNYFDFGADVARRGLNEFVLESEGSPNGQH